MSRKPFFEISVEIEQADLFFAKLKSAKKMPAEAQSIPPSHGPRACPISSSHIILPPFSTGTFAPRNDFAGRADACEVQKTAQGGRYARRFHHGKARHVHVYHPHGEETRGGRGQGRGKGTGTKPRVQALLSYRALLAPVWRILIEDTDVLDVLNSSGG